MEARECSTSAAPAGEAGKRHLLGELAAHALALVARQVDASARSRVQPSARRACAPRRVVTTVSSSSGSAGASAGDEPAQVGLRPARDAGVEEQRVEADVARALARQHRTLRPQWATSTGTSSPATSRDVTRHFAARRQAARRRLRHRLARRALPRLHRHRRLAGRGRGGARPGRHVLLGDVDEPLPFDDDALRRRVLKDLLEHVATPSRSSARSAASAPGRARLRLLARRPALGLGRLHPPPPVHAQGVSPAVRRPGLERRARRLRVGHAGHIDRRRAAAGQPAPGSAHCARVAADLAAQRLDHGEKLTVRRRRSAARERRPTAARRARRRRRLEAGAGRTPRSWRPRPAGHGARRVHQARGR